MKAGQGSGATHFMWFDDDMRFPKDTILRLLEHDKEIVCANYRFRNRPEQFVSYTKGKGYIDTTDKSSGLEKVTGIGFGVLLTKKSAFEKIERPWFVIGYNEKTDEYIDEGAFCCLKWFRAGVEIFIDYDHVGTSEFHPLHGQVRQARFNRSGINADLYISGPSPYVGPNDHGNAG